MTDQALLILAGDGRTYEIQANPDNSRAFFILNFETGEGTFQANPTCLALGGCQDALKFSAGNSLTTSIAGNSITLDGSLKNSILKGRLIPSIDFVITVGSDSTGVVVNGFRNYYPSLEITQTINGSTKFILQRLEINPVMLYELLGYDFFNYP